MKFKSFLFSFSLLLFISSNSQAGEFWSGKTNIKTLYPSDTGYVFNVNYSNSLSTCDGGSRFSISLTSPNYQALVSTLMAAFFSGKEISIHVYDNQGTSCSPALDRFIVYP